MELNVTSCCRLCLKNAHSERAVPIDLLERPDVGELINDLYGLRVHKSERGSKFICLTCYTDAVKLRKQLNLHQSKTKLIALNQKVLEAQDKAFPDPDEDEPYTELPTGYRPPKATPAKMLLQLDDCMRSAHFRELLLNPFELGYIRVSGQVYQESIDGFMDMWYPVQSFCSKCRQSFWDPAHFEEHLATCKHKCLFCRRAYSAYDSWVHHTCSKRETYRKNRKAMRIKAAKAAVPTKRIKLGDPKQVVKARPSVLSKTPDKTSKVSLARSSMPARSPAPQIEGEASLDNELSHLLERWYGQADDLEDLDYQEMAALQHQQPAPNNTFTNSQLANKVIDNAFKPNVPPRKPAISVKPISQLLDTNNFIQSPVAPPPPLVALNTVQNEVELEPLSDVIEIEDDEEMQPAPVASTSAGLQTAQSVAAQKALSENDILNIVKHFRGIDENESYLVKAKINGSQKLICISKRKGEGGTIATSNPASMGANKAIRPPVESPVGRPGMAVKPNLSVPTARPAPMVSKTHTPSGKPATIVSGAQIKPSFKTTSPANPVTITKNTVPQLKIAHVQSLVQQPQTSGISLGHANGNPQMPKLTKRFVKAQATHVPPMATAGMSSNSAMSTAPRNIIVGNNSMQMTNRSINVAPRQPGPPQGQSGAPPAQRKFIVQRKPQPVQQSMLNRPPVSLNTNSADHYNLGSMDRNSLLRNQLSQLPTKQYPISQLQLQQQRQPVISAVSSRGGAVPLQNGVINAINDSTLNNFKLNNTIIRRVE